MVVCPENNIWIVRTIVLSAFRIDVSPFTSAVTVTKPPMGGLPPPLVKEAVAAPFKVNASLIIPPPFVTKLTGVPSATGFPN